MRETDARLAELDRVGGAEGIEALIDAAVVHQLKRPTLARLIDIEEDRLPSSAEVERVGAHIRAGIGRLLDAPDMAWVQRHPLDADDLLAIVKGMGDAAGQRDERHAEALRQRVKRAVFGYLAAR